jgi:23S rRNA (guanosine2251-2'-O)-methyltransferase
MLIDSKNAIIEALKKNIVKKLIIKEGVKCGDFLKYNNVAIEMLSHLDFKKKYKYYQSGILADLDYQYAEFNKLLNKEKNFIILDHLQDPYNFGSLLRAAHQFNFNNIIIAKNNQVEVTNTVVRTSVGAIFHMNICSVVNLSRIVEILKANNYFVYATDINSNKNIESIEFNYKFAILLGSEGFGVRKNLLKKADESFKINTFGSIDSLNVSQSAAIIFYELSKLIK